MASAGPEATVMQSPTRLVVPALLGVGTVLACTYALRFMAGPHIVPEFLERRFATGLWVWQGVLSVVMGYSAGYVGLRRPGLGGAALALVVGALGALLYLKQGIVGGGPVTVALMGSMGLIAGALGALVALLVKDGGVLVPGLYVLVGVGALLLTFARTGTISGTGTRTVKQVTAGMMTGEKDVPVPDIEVVLTTPDGKTRLYQTRSDARGSYALNGPPPGEYMLFAHDTDPARGTGTWVSTRVTVGAMFSGLGLGTGDFSLPSYSETSASPFLDSAPALPGPGAAPGGGASSGPGGSGQVQQLLDQTLH